MTNNEPDYKEDLYFENNKIQTTGIDDTKTQANLTEQWKKGELSEGHYYVKDGENMIAEYLDGYFYNNGEPMTSFSGGVDEVLAPVPTFDEWKASYNCMLENEVLRLKNAQLKDLLKEIKGKIKMYYDDARREFYSSAEFSDDLIKKIDEVLK